MHESTSLANIFLLLTSVDSLESAHAVEDSMALLSDFCHEIADEYDEAVLAVSGSDSDLSRVKKHTRNKDRRRGRDNSKGACGHSRSKSIDKRQVVTGNELSGQSLNTIGLRCIRPKRRTATETRS